MWPHSVSGLATAHDDLALEVRHRSSDTGGGLSNVCKKRMFTIGLSGGGDYFKAIFHKICDLASVGASTWFIYCNGILVQALNNLNCA